MGALYESMLPAGAADDPKAPFNEPLDVEHRRFVSVCISYYDTVEASPDATPGYIDYLFRKKVEDGEFPKEFSINDFVTVDD